MALNSATLRFSVHILFTIFGIRPIIILAYCYKMVLNNSCSPSSKCPILAPFYTGTPSHKRQCLMFWSQISDPVRALFWYARDKTHPWNTTPWGLPSVHYITII